MLCGRMKIILSWQKARRNGYADCGKKAKRAATARTFQGRNCGCSRSPDPVQSWLSDRREESPRRKTDVLGHPATFGERVRTRRPISPPCSLHREDEWPFRRGLPSHFCRSRELHEFSWSLPECAGRLQRGSDA